MLHYDTRAVLAYAMIGSTYKGGVGASVYGDGLWGYVDWSGDFLLPVGPSGVYLSLTATANGSSYNLYGSGTVDRGGLVGTKGPIAWHLFANIGGHEIPYGLSYFSEGPRLETIATTCGTYYVDYKLEPPVDGWFMEATFYNRLYDELFALFQSNGIGGNRVGSWGFRGVSGCMVVNGANSTATIAGTLVSSSIGPIVYDSNIPDWIGRAIATSIFRGTNLSGKQIVQSHLVVYGVVRENNANATVTIGTLLTGEQDRIQLISGYYKTLGPPVLASGDVWEGTLLWQL